MAVEPGLAPIFAGWNVWNVWQKNDLDTELMMIGLDADRRLRIWVEDTADKAPDAGVADSANPNPKHLKGDEVEILAGVPSGLEVISHKEQVPGFPLLLNGPATLRSVRFFNRGGASNIAWPHDSNYLLDAVYQPSATNPITSAPAPSSVTGGIASAGKEIAEDVGAGFKYLAMVAVAVAVVVVVVKATGKGAA